MAQDENESPEPNEAPRFTRRQIGRLALETLAAGAVVAAGVGAVNAFKSLPPEQGDISQPPLTLEPSQLASMTPEELEKVKGKPLETTGYVEYADRLIDLSPVFQGVQRIGYNRIIVDAYHLYQGEDKQGPSVILVRNQERPTTLSPDIPSPAPVELYQGKRLDIKGTVERSDSAFARLSADSQALAKLGFSKDHPIYFINAKDITLKI